MPFLPVSANNHFICSTLIVLIEADADIKVVIVRWLLIELVNVEFRHCSGL